jgi:endonuclease/exonuclease/phosphatase family metal-dependent hydrolase
MKRASLVVAIIVSAFVLPVLAVAAIAGAIVAPVATAGSTCSLPSESSSVPGPWRAPLNGRYTVTSRFGMRFHPVLQTTKLHTGIDLVATADTTVVAAAGGTVTTREYNVAYGNQVIINHGGGIQTRYAHMARPARVTVGQHIDPGEPLGIQGATGFVTGAHLHFEIIRGGSPIDPAPFMTDRGAALNGGAAGPTSVTDASSAVQSNSARADLNVDQLANADVIVHVAYEIGAGRRGAIVALMAALQESGLRNLGHGDRDSLGMFQQRAGWGTAAQRQDREYAARAFFGGPAGPNGGRPPGLLDTPDWQTKDPGAAAQAVQVSAFPDAYRRWQPVAVALIARLNGGALDSVDCTDAGSAPGQLRVATWNVCLEFCDGKLAPWRDRVPVIASVLKAQHPDVISLQETGLRKAQGAAMIAALAPEYRLAVYKRSKMILYDPSKVSTASDDGTRHGSRAWVIEGKGGVAQAFRDKGTDGLFVLSSLHPVDGNEETRRMRYISRAFRTVAGLAHELSESVVIHAGDLNSTVPGSAVASFFAGEGFRSAEQITGDRHGQQFRSYNGGHPPRRGPRIDHVMVDPRVITVDSWRQVLSQEPTAPESDHYLIIVDLGDLGENALTGF